MIRPGYWSQGCGLLYYWLWACCNAGVALVYWVQVILLQIYSLINTAYIPNMCYNLIWYPCAALSGVWDCYLVPLRVLVGAWYCNTNTWFIRKWMVYVFIPEEYALTSYTFVYFCVFSLLIYSDPHHYHLYFLRTEAVAVQ